MGPREPCPFMISETKVFSNEADYMAKMAAMSICG